jgi:hypothetical protein
LGDTWKYRPVSSYHMELVIVSADAEELAAGFGSL